jgi:hypothetical protein
MKAINNRTKITERYLLTTTTRGGQNRMFASDDLEHLRDKVAEVKRKGGTSFMFDSERDCEV